VYHLELRQFPHNFNHFNVDEQELRGVVDPWVRGAPIALGEREWSPHKAKLTILQGPRLPIEELSMGRGWRAAQRESQDVTERVLAAATAAATQAGKDAAQAPAQETAAGGTLLSDPLALGVQIAALLGRDPTRLLEAWRAAAATAPALAPSESLALAERELRSSGGGSG